LERTRMRMRRVIWRKAKALGAIGHSPQKRGNGGTPRNWGGGLRVQSSGRVVNVGERF
jgi:hypothetical protein